MPLYSRRGHAIIGEVPVQAHVWPELTLDPKPDRQIDADPDLRRLRGRRIAVLFHERDRRPQGSALHAMAECWREAGIQVRYLFGVRETASADLLVMHVNLSVVPAAYLDYAQRFPVVLNGRVRDIRKSAFSRQLVRPGDAYQGPVIVKSDLNYGGESEQRLGGNLAGRCWQRLLANRYWRGLLRRIAPRVLHRHSPKGYRIYPLQHMLPARDWRDPRLVVERFLPETEDGLYFVRQYHFLGDQGICVRIGARVPIVNSQNRVSRERVPLPPEIEAQRRTLGFDFGKFDFVLHRGEPVLLDINKTPGAGARNAARGISAGLRRRAAGVLAYFRD